MRKFLLTGILCFAASSAMAFTNIYRSTHTATADPVKPLCTSGGATRRGVLHTACVNTGTAGTLTLYNSFSTAVQTIAAINTANALCQTYDISTSSGLSYATTATADVTISYECY
jgi:hypothetical protein